MFETTSTGAPAIPTPGVRYLAASAHPTARFHSTSMTAGDRDTGISALLGNDLTTLAEDESWAGVWTCGPCEMAFAPKRDVAMIVLEGAATVTFGNGESTTIRPGDALSVARGSATIWRVDVYYKEFVVYFGEK